jgi:hypothetical protein
VAQVKLAGHVRRRDHHHEHVVLGRGVLQSGSVRDDENFVERNLIKYLNFEKLSFVTPMITASTHSYLEQLL